MKAFSIALSLFYFVCSEALLKRKVSLTFRNRYLGSTTSQLKFRHTPMNLQPIGQDIAVTVLTAGASSLWLKIWTNVRHFKNGIFRKVINMDHIFSLPMREKLIPSYPGK